MKLRHVVTYYGDKKYGIWWVRVFGYGLLLKHPKTWRSFSERNGYDKFIEFRGWRLKYLPRR